MQKYALASADYVFDHIFYSLCMHFPFYFGFILAKKSYLNNAF